MDDEKVYIMDMYNRWIYPNDIKAKCKYMYFSMHTFFNKSYTLFVVQLLKEFHTLNYCSVVKPPFPACV